MTEYSIRLAELEDVKFLAPRVREDDVKELWAGYHLSPRMALMGSFLVSRDTSFSFSGVADEEVVCMFGVKPPTLLGRKANPWMIASQSLPFHSKEFLRQSRAIVKIFREEFDYMCNYVDARNTMAVRWLQWVGFTLYYPEPFGADNLPFHYFDMGAE